MAAPRYLANVAGKIKMLIAAVVATADSLVATDATGRIDVSFMPVGIGAEVLTSVVASEALAAGDFVNIYNNAGTLNVRKADATTNAKPALGFVLAAVANAGLATIYLLSQTNTGLSGLTLGSDYYLSATPGTVTTTSPSATGNISQFLGRAHSATAMVFANETYIEVA